jgi:hypothetical protein
MHNYRPIVNVDILVTIKCFYDEPAFEKIREILLEPEAK